MDDVNRAAGVRRPGRGRPARISRGQIVAAARGLPPEGVTMQAVATALGVDRSTLHYHVPDREALVELVASDILQREFAAAELPAGGDWRETLRVFGRHIRDAMIAAGAFSAYYRLPAHGAPEALQQTEQALRELIDAGLSETDAGHALVMLSQLAAAAARDVTMAARNGTHPQIAEVTRAHAAAPPGQLDAARRFFDTWAPASDEQFEFNLDLLITGVEQRLTPA
ncbi:TetR/AcrR family transcriptional regulator C-terminal domain-containing protein [Streptacidiphilus sp. N1-10]|uniref:TetR/AcrR family transcriptional regulator C-terminal domain-containing protein n=1 Tax=Streptacidiphilus jeojiensis TaxID=3229225 RepID=A0ABV6XWI2_9ACTN